MSPAPLAAPLAAPLVALLACACAAELYKDETIRNFVHNDRSSRSLGMSELPHGCLYDGRWYTEGSVVATREACLRCACAHGALACRRRACAPLPDPPPHRCHVLHRRGSCCAELHCPEEVMLMEHSASSRFENEDNSDIATPASVVHACVEGGTVYSAGSAMSSNTACEQCFCLGGARRCVRPRCLPPPSGCRPRPAPGACCPQRYYCEHVSTKPPDQKNSHDCEVKGKMVSEGERVVTKETGSNCTQCFCLRGSVRCQPLACSPPLLGCKPLLQPGHCCPHQYHCEHQHPHQRHGPAAPYLLITNNALISSRNDDRSFHTSNEHETTTKAVSSSAVTKRHTPSATPTKKNPVTTTKVKRKTDEPSPTSSSQKPIAINDRTDKVENVTTTTISTTQKLPTTTDKITTTTEETTTPESLEKTSTEQPEGSVKVMINGTINCTAELSSTSLPLNVSSNDTEKIKLEVQPRIPYLNMEAESHTFNPNDIITDRNVNGGFDENETFTINVTSSLRTNTTQRHSTSEPKISTVSKVAIPTDLPESLNISKKTKGDYDYDYTEPTLPPSLPNLKIIPFVAADAVVDEPISSKQPLMYPVLEREDKFPVYYPNVDSKDVPYATRREDVYRPTQYPVFTSEKVDLPQYPALSHEVDLTKPAYPNINNELSTPVHDYGVSTSVKSHVHGVKKAVTNVPSTSSKFKLETPSMNLFSPPVETEGGFIPKGPGIIEEYYAVYPSTPSGPSVPHLTTSMQLDTVKGECITGDGRHIAEGDSISLACSICTCAWGELHCSPRPCHTPLGCKRRPASSNSVDLCCGELVCDNDNKTTSAPISSKKTLITLNETKIPAENKTEVEPVETSSLKLEQENGTIISEDVSNEMNTTQKRTTVKIDTDGESTTHKYLPSSVTEKLLPASTIATTLAVLNNKEVNETKNHSQEYEDEEEEEFSFGSVLKLLLSDYDKTTISPTKKMPTTSATKILNTAETTPSTPTTSMMRPTLKPSLVPFIPMPNHHHLYTPPKKILAQNSVNRIDHLVLGEATAIKRPSPRPATVAFKPITPPPRPMTTIKPITQGPSTRPIEVTKKEEEQHKLGSTEGSRPPSPAPMAGVGPGLLKLAGCNIYGRMYRVGRIISELSTPCLECRCTELGVQCRPLDC